MPYHMTGHVNGRPISRHIHLHRDEKDVCEDCQDPAWGEDPHFFWDETGGCHGPWPSLESALDALERYQRTI